MFDAEGGRLLEIVGRVAVIYGVCLVLLRVSGRRELAELSQLDLLTMLLISETVSPALTGGDDSLAGGAVAATALFALYGGSRWIAFRSRRAERLMQGAAIILIEDGRVRTEVLRRHRITDDDLRTTLHQHGLLRVSEVRRAYIEPDGKVTIIKQPAAA
jgi:uncharacterized membrane protein YcaP (DUF421 family)